MNSAIIAGGVSLVLLGYFTYKAPRLTLVLIGSFIATVFVSAALLLILPGEFGEKAIWMALLVPIIWVALQFWCYWDQSAKRVVIGHVLMSVLGGLIVFFVEPKL
ncbi:MAG: hypothetical protein AAF431_14175 [Pseudomonadota bacterium]